MKRIHIILAAGVLLSAAIHAYAGFDNECREVRAETLRLHVMANSDSEGDQELKLKVRDAILEEADGFERTESKLWLIEDAAREIIQAEGYDYPVKAELVNMFFTTRQYGDITVPAGRYDAVRLTIGQGEGENWWCVMFPPMCLPAAMGEKLPLEIQIEEIGTNPRYKPKFAVLELIETVREKLSGEEEVILLEAGGETPEYNNR